MHYVDEGSGPPILFLHGTPTNSYEYRHLISALSPTHRCIAPDHLGFGLSDRPASFAYTPEAHAEALREFVATLGLDRFTLVVHDFGGPIGLPLALAGDARVDRLVIMNSWAWPLDDDPMAKAAKFMSGAAGRFLYRYANASLRLIMPSAYGDRRKLTKAIHQQYLQVFRDRDARVLVDLRSSWLTIEARSDLRLEPTIATLLGRSRFSTAINARDRSSNEESRSLTVIVNISVASRANGVGHLELALIDWSNRRNARWLDRFVHVPAASGSQAESGPRWRVFRRRDFSPAFQERRPRCQRPLS